MNKDLDRLLSESLTSVQESYATERQADRIEARARFIERYRRRRRRLMIGSVALAGAAVIGLGVVATQGFDIFAGPSRVAGQPEDLPRGVLAQIGTGDQAVDAGIQSGGVWVANAGDQTLSRVDAATNEVLDQIELDGPPQEVDVGEGGVWVAGFGRVTALDPDTGEVLGMADLGSADDSISISVGEGAVWAVVGDRSLYRVDPESFEAQEVAAVSAPVDVAARDGAVWVLDQDQGLLQLDPGTGDAVGEPLPDVPGRGDISAGQGVVWIGNKQDDTLLRIDAATRDISGVFQVTGTYIDMAVSETVIWVLSRTNEDARLTALDPNSNGEVLGTLRISGDPVEVSAGQTGLWVVSRGRGALLRVDADAVLQPN